MAHTSGKPRIAAVHPVLPSKDVPQAVAWYVHKLGFHMEFVDDPSGPRYAGLRRDDVALHLQWHDEAEWERVERPMLRLRVDDVAALFQEYRDKGVFHEHTDLRKTDWGTEEFAFFDRDMNGLTFYRDLVEDE
jgi:catechol 2,3-dioxygenase-like lactoylglutathione lyase family enzyme